MGDTIPSGPPRHSRLRGTETVARTGAGKHLARARQLCVVLLFLTACSPGGTPSPSTHSIGGTMSLVGSAGFTSETSHACAGKGGYADIAAGAPVTIKDQTDAVIGLGTLGRGTWTLDSASVATCTFPFLVPDVPNATFYSIEISHRGEVRYAAADLAAKQWSVALTIGGS